MKCHCITPIARFRGQRKNGGFITPNLSLTYIFTQATYEIKVFVVLIILD